MPDVLFQQELLVRGFIDEVLNQRRVHQITDYVDLDAIEYKAFIVSDGLQGDNFRGDIERLLGAFSALRVEVLHIVNATDQIAVRLNLSGRHTGALPQAPQPSMRAATWDAIAVLRLRAGRIVELNGVADRLRMLQQLGMAGG
jgi:predicted ester cyclase